MNTIKKINANTLNKIFNYHIEKDDAIEILIDILADNNITEDDIVFCQHNENYFFAGEMKEATDSVFVHEDSINDYEETLNQDNYPEYDKF